MKNRKVRTPHTNEKLIYKKFTQSLNINRSVYFVKFKLNQSLPKRREEKKRGERGEKTKRNAEKRELRSRAAMPQLLLQGPKRGEPKESKQRI